VFNPCWEPVWQVALSPDGRTVACAARNKLVLWDVAARKARFSAPTDERWRVLKYAPDGNTLIAAGERHIIFWDASGEKVQEWPMPTDVFGLAFSRDGRHLLCANDDGTVYVFRLPHGGVK
jgi:WD40 repeat protein